MTEPVFRCKISQGSVLERLDYAMLTNALTFFGGLKLHAKLCKVMRQKTERNCQYAYDKKVSPRSRPGLLGHFLLDVSSGKFPRCKSVVRMD